MRISHLLLHNITSQGNKIAARMKENGYFSDTSVERFYSVRQNKSYDKPE